MLVEDSVDRFRAQLRNIYQDWNCGRTVYQCHWVKCTLLYHVPSLSISLLLFTCVFIVKFSYAHVTILSLIIQLATYKNPRWYLLINDR